MSAESRHLDHEALRDDLAAYALGALPEAEAADLEGHLAECESCRARLHWLTPAVDLLPVTVKQETPPPALGENLMAIVRAEAADAAEEAAPVAAPEPARRSAAARQPWWRSLSGFAMRPAVGFAALILLVAGVAGGYVIRGGSEEGPTTTLSRATGIGPAAGEVSATLERTGDSATLHVHSMPKLARDQVYEVWVQRADVMEPKSLFVLSKDGTAEAAVTGPLDGAEAVYVTAEDRGGASQPSLPALLEAKL